MIISSLFYHSITMKNIICFLMLIGTTIGQSQMLFKPDRVFDGTTVHPDWVVLVEGKVITYVGAPTELKTPKGTQEVPLKNMTLMPGIIEGHSHLLLHPYNETDWNDQVLKESPVERAIRGTVHAKNSLMAGITTVRDLGSEGAAYADVSLKKTIDQGIVAGPRMLVAGPAIVATGAYGPKGFHDGVSVPLGAEPVSGVDEAKSHSKDGNWEMGPILLKSTPITGGVPGNHPSPRFSPTKLRRWYPRQPVQEDMWWPMPAPLKVCDAPFWVG